MPPGERVTTGSGASDFGSRPGSGGLDDYLARADTYPRDLELDILLVEG